MLDIFQMNTNALKRKDLKTLLPNQEDCNSCLLIIYSGSKNDFTLQLWCLLTHEVAFSTRNENLFLNGGVMYYILEDFKADGPKKDLIYTAPSSSSIIIEMRQFTVEKYTITFSEYPIAKSYLLRFFSTKKNRFPKISFICDNKIANNPTRSIARNFFTIITHDSISTLVHDSPVPHFYDVTFLFDNLSPNTRYD